jgi:hypothetical protein
VYYANCKSLAVDHPDFVSVKMNRDHSNAIDYISFVDKIMNVVVQKMMIVQNGLVIALGNDGD